MNAPRHPLILDEANSNDSQNIFLTQKMDLIRGADQRLQISLCRRYIDGGQVTRPDRIVWPS